MVEVGAPRTSADDPSVYAAALGAIPAGGKVPVGALDYILANPTSGAGQLDPGPFLDLLLRRSVATRPEDVGELRLVAWSGKPLPGQVIEPAVDRIRGFTLVVAHLRPAPLLDPSSARYYALAKGAETLPAEPPIPPPDPNMMIRRGVRVVPGGAGMSGGMMVAPVPALSVPTAPPRLATDPTAQPADPNSAPAPTPTPNAPEIPRP